NRTNPRGAYPRFTSYQTAAVDQDAGLLVLYVPPLDGRPAQTWTYDPHKNVWKDMAPKVQPPGVAGAGLVYDPFHTLLLLQRGRPPQCGGSAAPVTWAYDVRTNTGPDLKAKTGRGNPWVGAMDFDPDPNVCLLFNFRDGQVWAYRPKPVKPGARGEP